MTTNQITRAQAAGRLQESLDILHERLSAYLLVTINQSRKSPYDQQVLRSEVNSADFSALAKFVARDHWNDLLVCHKGGCPKELRGLARRAIDIRNSVSHQSFDFDKYEHDLETLAKLATAINESDVARDIRAKTSIPPTLDAWEELKEKGNACFKQKQWTDAMNYYTQALRLNQKQPVLYANRALCEINLNKYQLAREDAEDAIELDSKQVKYYRILSEALMALELFSEIIGACDEGLKIEPRDSILLKRHRDCKAHLMTKYTDKYNPRSLQPEPASLEEYESQMKALIITPTPCDEDIIDITDYSTFLKVNSLMIEIKRLFRIGTTEHEGRILQLFEDMARLDSAEGYYNLGVIYSKGGTAGVVRDYARCKLYQEKAAVQKPYCRLDHMVLRNIGVAEAENGLGVVYRDGAGVDVDQVKATRYFRRSAEHGCPEGQNNFGIALLAGLGIKQNKELARSWFARAAECGIAEAEFNYAHFLADGIGGPVNIQLALDFYRRAADQGYPDAFKKIQEVRARTGSLSKSVADKETAEKDPNALMLRAANYARGEGGFHKDMNLAEQYYRRAIDCGNVEAEFALAEILLDHFKRNAEGFTFMKQAAEKGHALAQWRLGRLFAFGHGCERNLDEARRWLKRGKRQGVQYSSNFGKDTKEEMIDVDQELNVAKAVYNFEQKHPNLSTEGITIEERTLRHLNELLPLEMPRIPNIASLSVSPDETSMLIPHEYSLFNKKIFEEVGRRANTGSVTAQQYMMAIAILIQGLDQIESSPANALSLLRSAYLLCERIPVALPFITAAQIRLELNPYDADAVHVIARAEHRSFKERVALLEECIKHYPLAADIHHLLANMYMFVNEYDKAERACTRALELEFHPDWLYTQVGAIKFADDSRNGNNMMFGTDFCPHNTANLNQIRKMSKASTSRSDEIIDKYNSFLKLNPVDHKKVPMVHFTLAFIHMQHNNYQLAHFHWIKWQETDDLNVRLPCHEPVEVSSQMKGMMDMLFNMQGLSLESSSSTLQLSSSSSSAAEMKEPIKMCDQCGKLNPPKRCPCSKVNYCDVKCQRAHWPVHKTIEEHKK